MTGTLRYFKQSFVWWKDNAKGQPLKEYCKGDQSV